MHNCPHSQFANKYIFQLAKFKCHWFNPIPAKVGGGGGAAPPKNTPPPPPPNFLKYLKNNLAIQAKFQALLAVRP